MFLVKKFNQFFRFSILTGTIFLLNTSIFCEPSYNSNLKVYYHFTSEAKFYFSKDRAEHFGLLKNNLKFGLRKLQTAFSMYGLPKKQSFWFFGKKKDLEQVLLKKCGESKSNLNHIFKNGIVRSSCGIFILYPEGADLDEVLRIVFQEYSFQLVHKLMNNYKSKYIGWFQTGLPVYLSWQVTGEITGESLVETNAALIEYYSSYFNPEIAEPLDNLERKNQWNHAFDLSPNQIFGQAVVSYMYWSTKTRHNAGIVLLSRIKKSNEFQNEFERLSGVRLHEFEAELRKNVYPEIKRWRKNKKIPNSGQRIWPVAIK